MKVKTKIIALLFVILLSLMVLMQAQSYNYPKPKEIEKRINYLERIIYQPLEEGSDILQLGYENKEFMLFSYSFATYALTNLAIHDSYYSERAIKLIRESVTKVLDYKIAAQFGLINGIDNMDTLHEYSVLYLGHLNLMLGCYRLLSSDSIFNDLNDKISKSLFDRYNKKEYLNLESYPSLIWIPDNAVAIASLKLHSHNANSTYNSICLKWIQYVKSNYTDSKTGILYSTINHKTGEPVEEPRGSMIGWSIMFIYQFDSDFATDLYINFKKNFSKNYIAFRLFRERFQVKRSSIGDIDSGPIIWGFSIPANEFALGNSILAKDYKTAIKLKRLIDFGTKKINKNNELKYKVRFIKMNISPMAEALVLNSLTITKWIN